MIGFFLQATNDTIAAATGAVVQNIVKENEISVLEFILKGGFFLIPISLLLFYTIYVLRYSHLNTVDQLFIIKTFSIELTNCLNREMPYCKLTGVSAYDTGMLDSCTRRSAGYGEVTGASPTLLWI